MQGYQPISDVERLEGADSRLKIQTITIIHADKIIRDDSCGATSECSFKGAEVVLIGVNKTEHPNSLGHIKHGTGQF